jgi:hypothetical protein
LVVARRHPAISRSPIAGCIVLARRCTSRARAHGRARRVARYSGEGKKIKVAADGPNGKTFLETEARLSAFGGFWFDLDLPGDARLGDCVIHGRLDSGTFTRAFLVEAYRPATYEVTGCTGWMMGPTKAAMVVKQGAVRRPTRSTSSTSRRAA